MRYVDVSDEYVASVLSANKLKADQKIDESAKVDQVQEEEQVEGHVCPLCESHLEEAIPEENLQECVDYILDSINEAVDLLEEEDLLEAEEGCDDDEESEEDEDEDK